MAEEHQAQNQLLQPGFGPGEVEQDWFGQVVGGLEGVIESLAGLLEELIDEFAADVVGSGELADSLSSEGLQDELLALRGRQGVGGTGRGGRGVRRHGLG